MCFPTDGVMSYSAPVASSYMGKDTQDVDSYDGNISLVDNLVTGGLGKLTDDVYGTNRLHFDNSHLSAWVAYKTRVPVITIRLSKRRVVRKVIYSCCDHLDFNSILVKLQNTFEEDLGTCCFL